MHGSRLTVMRGGAMHLSTRERVSTHATQAWKIAIALGGTVVAEGTFGRIVAEVLVVPPYVAQSMRGDGTVVAHFAEPGSSGAPFAGPGSGLARPWVPDRARCEALVSIARAGEAVPASQRPEVAAEVLDRLRLEGVRRLDARVEHALRACAADPDLSIDAFAGARRISASRLRHLVVQETGLALRTHRLWHRTMAAVESMLAGAPIARAACDAGFADHGHFTRSFGRFFGRAPSSLTAEVELLAHYGERGVSVPSHASSHGKAWP